MFITKNVLKYASYSRLSHEDGDKSESDSIKGQKELIKNYVKNKSEFDDSISLEYEDDGYSGVNFERPAFQRMMTDIKAGLINCVIVKDLSRLGRNYIEMGRLLEQLFPFLGVRFIAINDNYDSLTHNAQTDNLLIPFKNLINDSYCADTSRKIRSQLEVKRQKGQYIGSFAAYGYVKSPENKHKLLIDAQAAQTVKDIFEWKIKGMSAQAIANRLNELGILSPCEYKKANGSRYVAVFQTHICSKWSAVAVGRILKSRIYTGTLTQGVQTTPNYKVKKRITKAPEEWIITENAHECIINPIDFALVQDLLLKDTRSAPNNSEVYLFSGLAVCGDCGRSMVRKTIRDNDKKYIYYVCSKNKAGDGCKPHSISEGILIEAVFEAIHKHISRCVEIEKILTFAENLPMLTDKSIDLQNKLDNKKLEIEKISKRQTKLYEDLSDGLLTKDEYICFKEAFQAKLTTAKTALTVLNSELEATLKNEDVSSEWISYFKKHHDIETLNRTAICELVSKITIYDKGAIEITFRFSEQFAQALSIVQAIESTNDFNERTA